MPYFDKTQDSLYFTRLKRVVATAFPWRPYSDYVHQYIQTLQRPCSKRPWLCSISNFRRLEIDPQMSPIHIMTSMNPEHFGSEALQCLEYLHIPSLSTKLTCFIATCARSPKVMLHNIPSGLCFDQDLFHKMRCTIFLLWYLGFGRISDI